MSTAEPSSQPADQAFVETPASRENRPTVAVFGAGIAGLTAAHELAERGFRVTVYEPELDQSSRRRPMGLDVRIGGMAATQYPSENWQPRRFPNPGWPDRPVDPHQAVRGEHGFRFFPAYYLHLWDMLQRIPVYDSIYEVLDPQVTPRTVYDNVQRVITQAAAAIDGWPSLVLPREMPRSSAELYGSYNLIRRLGFAQTDISTFLGRVLRFLVTTPERRARELEDVSAYDFLLGIDPATGDPRYHYSEVFVEQIADMPKILAAFDSRWGDARTNLSTYVQLNMALDRYDSKADGVLNGPTTEAWFDHWYVHLRKLGVEFRSEMLRYFAIDEIGTITAVVAPFSQELLAHDLGLDGDLGEDPTPSAATARDADYYVVATDAYRAELATRPLREHADYTEVMAHFREVVRTRPGEIDEKRALRAMSTVLGLDGWTTSAPPPDDPHQLDRASLPPRNPLKFDELGTVAWDRFQTLSGIQYFFDTEFQIVRGHVYFSKSKWGLSAINQSGFWTDKPNLEDDGYVSVMSVDIGDWNEPSIDGKSARECTVQEIAEEVWRQITVSLLDTFGADVVGRQLPRPIWYTVDESIVFKAEGDHSPFNETRPELDRIVKPRFNRAPYLIPRVGDWKNRPGAYPWNPQGTSPSLVPNDAMLEVQRHLRVWQARHGGYQVHNDKLVFAGTWCKTFTRMTSMEAACESGRHAVNAILDHYVYAQSGGNDLRDLPTLSWRLPFGFVDQELSSPIRSPMPAGDYAFIFDCENREPADARPTRQLDSDHYWSGLPHPWQLWGIDHASAVASTLNSDRPPVDPYSSTPGVIKQLRQLRRLIETTFGGAEINAEAEPARDGPGGPRPSVSGLTLAELLPQIDLVELPSEYGGGGIDKPAVPPGRLPSSGQVG